MRLAPTAALAPRVRGSAQVGAARRWSARLGAGRRCSAQVGAARRRWARLGAARRGTHWQSLTFGWAAEQLRRRSLGTLARAEAARHLRRLRVVG